MQQDKESPRHDPVEELIGRRVILVSEGLCAEVELLAAGPMSVEVRTSAGTVRLIPWCRIGAIHPKEEGRAG